MRAVNLIPGDTRGGGASGSIMAQAPTYAVLGLLAVALAFVTVYVLASNSIADKQAKLSGLQTQLAQDQAATANLVNFTQFEQLVQTRTQTVKSIASGRYDFNQALNDLSKVVPANTSLQTLNATVGSAAGTGGASTGSAGGASLLSSTTGPAIELTGCTKTQDDVARLMSRLRLVDGVTRVTLGNSQKPTTNAPTVSSTGTSGAIGCGSSGPTFDLVLALTPLATTVVAPGAAAAATSGAVATSTPATTTTTGAATPSSTTATPATGTTSTTPAATTTSSGSSK